MLKARTEAIIRIGATLGASEVLEEFGIDPVMQLVRAGFSADLFKDADKKISLSGRGRPGTLRQINWSRVFRTLSGKSRPS